MYYETYKLHVLDVFEAMVFGPLDIPSCIEVQINHNSSLGRDTYEAILKFAKDYDIDLEKYPIYSKWIYQMKHDDGMSEDPFSKYLEKVSEEE